ncbi:unnamed protein product [Blepharisma stoltei]|uniref:Uncharacterized protein n=1 Tax=Blepharisma stoltei TaxID=1481888 RepID=A0AAU9JE94_9CILI|nr:unnamed protein product [Blepharisma stoltei]
MATNSIVLIYTSTKVISESDIDMQITLGNIEKVMQSIALFSRSVHVLTFLGGSKELIKYTLDNFESQLILLQEIHTNITENLLGVHKCLGENAFVHEAVRIYNDDGSISKTKTNLIDAVLYTISKGYDFIRKVNKNENLETEIKYFVRNGGDEVFHYCNNTLYSLTDCEIQGIDDLKYRMDILLAVGFGTLVLCLGLTVPFALAVINMENKFWNLIKEHAYINYIELKQACLDRLMTTHGKVDTLFSDGNQISKNSDLKNYRKFSWRICIYLILALAFFLVNILYLYSDCLTYLHLRPNLLRDLINSQALYKSLWIWSSEISIIGFPVSLPNNTAKAYPFSDPRYELDHASASIALSEKAIKDSKYLPLLSDEFNKLFYEKCQTSNIITNYGVYATGKVLASEAYYLGYGNDPNFLDFWYSLTKELSVFNEEYDVLIKLADHDSQNLIESQLNFIIAALICFCVLSVIIYLRIFLSFLIKEKKYLSKMREMSRIIPDRFFKY